MSTRTVSPSENSNETSTGPGWPGSSRGPAATESRGDSNGRVEKAKALSVRLLRDEVAASKGKAKADGGSDEAAKTQQVNLRLYPEQIETLEAALEKMKEESGKDGRGVCLEWICASYLSGQFEIVNPAQSQAPGNLEAVASAVGTLLETAKDLAGSEIEAIEPIVTQMDRVFDSTVTVTVVE